MWDAISRAMYRMLAVLVWIPVTKAMRRVVHMAWRAARPANPPHNPKRPETRFADALIWSAITGVSWGMARLVSSKATAEVWRAVIGTEPPGTKPKRAPEVPEAISPPPAASDRSS